MINFQLYKPIQHHLFLNDDVTLEACDAPWNPETHVYTIWFKRSPGEKYIPSLQLLNKHTCACFSAIHTAHLVRRESCSTRIPRRSHLPGNLFPSSGAADTFPRTVILEEGNASRDGETVVESLCLSFPSRVDTVWGEPAEWKLPLVNWTKCSYSDRAWQDTPISRVWAGNSVNYELRSVGLLCLKL